METSEETFDRVLNLQIKQMATKIVSENIKRTIKVYRVSWRFRNTNYKDYKTEKRAKSIVEFLKEKGATDIKIDTAIAHEYLGECCDICGSKERHNVDTKEFGQLVCSNCGLILFHFGYNALNVIKSDNEY